MATPGSRAVRSVSRGTSARVAARASVQCAGLPVARRPFETPRPARGQLRDQAIRAPSESRGRLQGGALLRVAEVPLDGGL